MYKYWDGNCADDGAFKDKLVHFSLDFLHCLMCLFLLFVTFYDSEEEEDPLQVSPCLLIIAFK